MTDHALSCVVTTALDWAADDWGGHVRVAAEEQAATTYTDYVREQLRQRWGA